MWVGGGRWGPENVVVLVVLLAVLAVVFAAVLAVVLVVVIVLVLVAILAVVLLLSVTPRAFWKENTQGVNNHYVLCEITSTQCVLNIRCLKAQTRTLFFCPGFFREGGGQRGGWG